MKAGKLSKEDAKKKLAALAAASASAPKDKKLEAAMTKIKAVLRKGELTKQEAMAKLATLNKADVQKARVEHEAMVQKLKAAVKAGKLSPQDAKTKLAAIKKAAQSNYNRSVETVGNDGKPLDKPEPKGKNAKRNYRRRVFAVMP